MFRRSTRIPAPPGAGLTKIADPRLPRLGWLVFGAAVLVAGAILWPAGLGDRLSQLRAEFLALSYLRSAQNHAEGHPVRREQALAELERALQLAPQHPLVTENAAQLYVNLRAYEQALPWLRRQQERNTLTRISLAQALLMTGARPEGEALLGRVLVEAHRARRANQMPPQLYALILNNVGYVHTLAGARLSEARSLIEAAVNIEPRQSAYLDSLGWADFHLGDYQQAAFHLERAVRLHLPQESAEMYYHLGAAYARVGRKPAARLALQRALELDPSYTEAAQELKLLSQDLPQPMLAWRQSPAHRPLTALAPPMTIIIPVRL